jgi:hypothetical protein
MSRTFRSSIGFVANRTFRRRFNGIYLATLTKYQFQMKMKRWKRRSYEQFLIFYVLKCYFHVSPHLFRMPSKHRLSVYWTCIHAHATTILFIPINLSQLINKISLGPLSRDYLYCSLSKKSSKIFFKIKVDHLHFYYFRQAIVFSLTQ